MGIFPHEIKDIFMQGEIETNIRKLRNSEKLKVVEQKGGGAGGLDGRGS